MTDIQEFTQLIRRLVDEAESADKLRAELEAVKRDHNFYKRLAEELGSQGTATRDTRRSFIKLEFVFDEVMIRQAENPIDVLSYAFDRMTKQLHLLLAKK